MGRGHVNGYSCGSLERATRGLPPTPMATLSQGGGAAASVVFSGGDLSSPGATWPPNLPFLFTLPAWLLEALHVRPLKCPRLHWPLTRRLPVRESGLGFRSRAGGTAREAVGSEGSVKAVMARELRPVRGRQGGRGASLPRVRAAAL